MPDRRPEPKRSLGALLLTGALLLALPACQLTRGEGLRPTETRHDEGFTITESARLGVGARGRFDDALEAIEAGELDRGIELLEALAAEAPEVATLHIDLGIALRRADRFAAAETSLRRALDLHPTHPIALNETGILLRRMGRFEEARQAYAAALDRHPDFHHARKNLAILCDLYLGDLDCALDHYERYLELVPNDEQAAIWIADLQNRRSQGAR